MTREQELEFYKDHCAHCDAKLLFGGCLRCGAPVCCPQCCKIDRLTEQKAALTADNAELRAQRDDPKCDWANMVIACNEAGVLNASELVIHNRDLTAKLATATAEIARMKHQYYTVKDLYDAAQSRADKLQGELDEERKRSMEMARSVAHNDNRHREVISLISERQSKELRALQSERDALREAIITISQYVPRFRDAFPRPSGPHRGYDVWLHDYIAETLGVKMATQEEVEAALRSAPVDGEKGGM